MVRTNDSCCGETLESVSGSLDAASVRVSEEQFALDR